MKINTNRASGFTLVEIMIVVAIIGLLAAIAIPNFVKARATSQKNACINNLRQIDGAIQQWALETGALATAAVTTDNIKGYVGRKGDGTDICCPNTAAGTAFGGYTVTTVSAAPTCSQTALGHKLDN
jgi:prepilin-type N-terminal cleavage/methylation domain-containing protein